MAHEAWMLRKILLLLLLLLLLSLHQTLGATNHHFNGGTLACRFVKKEGTTWKVQVTVLSGWTFQEGPCGSSCDRSHEGQSTEQERRDQTAIDPNVFGTWTLTDKGKTGVDVTADVNNNVTGHVVAVNAVQGWEQELSSFVLDVADGGFIEIIWTGKSWVKNDYVWPSQQQLNAGGDTPFRLNVTLPHTKIRNDTGKPNTTPYVAVKPQYTAVVDEENVISVPLKDVDGDKVNCSKVNLTGAGVDDDLLDLVVLEEHALQSCTLVFTPNKSSTVNYKDGSYVIVSLELSDFLVHPVRYDGDASIHNPDGSPLSTIPLQFTIRLVSSDQPPQFTSPTPDEGTNYWVYVGSSLGIDLQAKPMQQGARITSLRLTSVPPLPVTLDPLSENNGKGSSSLNWSPSALFVGSYDVVVTAVDSLGNEADRHFKVTIRDFSYAVPTTGSNLTLIDTNDDPIICPPGTQCNFPLYIFNNHGDVSAFITVAYLHGMLNNIILTPPLDTTYGGVPVVLKNIQIPPLSHIGPLTLVMSVTDTSGAKLGEGKNFVRVKVDASSPCIDAPCLTTDFGQCQTDQFMTKCLCLPGTAGDECEDDINECASSPCLNQGRCQHGLDLYTCDCSPDFTGLRCETTVPSMPPALAAVTLPSLTTSAAASLTPSALPSMTPAPPATLIVPLAASPLLATSPLPSETSTSIPPSASTTASTITPAISALPVATSTSLATVASGSLARAWSEQITVLPTTSAKVVTALPIISSAAAATPLSIFALSSSTLASSSASALSSETSTLPTVPAWPLFTSMHVKSVSPSPAATTTLPISASPSAMPSTATTSLATSVFSSALPLTTSKQSTSAFSTASSPLTSASPPAFASAASVSPASSSLATVLTPPTSAVLSTATTSSTTTTLQTTMTTTTLTPVTTADLLSSLLSSTYTSPITSALPSSTSTSPSTSVLTSTTSILPATSALTATSTSLTTSALSSATSLSPSTSSMPSTTSTLPTTSALSSTAITSPSTSTVPSTTLPSTTSTVPTTTLPSTTPTVPSTTLPSTTPTVPSTTLPSTTSTVPTTTLPLTTSTAPSTTLPSTTSTAPITTLSSMAPTVPSTTLQSTTSTVPSTTLPSTTSTVPSTTLQSTTSTVPSTLPSTTSTVLSTLPSTAPTLITTSAAPIISTALATTVSLSTPAASSSKATFPSTSVDTSLGLILTTVFTSPSTSPLPPSVQSTVSSTVVAATAPTTLATTAESTAATVQTRTATTSLPMVSASLTPPVATTMPLVTGLSVSSTSLTATTSDPSSSSTGVAASSAVSSTTKGSADSGDSGSVTTIGGAAGGGLALVLSGVAVMVKFCKKGKVVSNPEAKKPELQRTVTKAWGSPNQPHRTPAPSRLSVHHEKAIRQAPTLNF